MAAENTSKTLDLSKTIFTDLLDSIAKYLIERGEVLPNRPAPKKSFMGSLRQKTSNRLKTGRFLYDVLSVYAQQTKNPEKQLYKTLFLINIFIEKTLELESAKKLDSFEKSELLKCISNNLSLALTGNKATGNMDADLKNISRNIDSMLLNMRKSNEELSLHDDYVKKVAEFITIPMVKEHQFAAHPEKIDAALEIAKLFLTAKPTSDYVVIMQKIADAIEMSRSKGSMARSTDLEMALIPLADYIAKMIGFMPDQAKQVVDIFRKQRPEDKGVYIPGVLYLVSKDDIATKKGYIDNIFNYLFGKNQSQEVDAARYLYENAEILIKTLKEINDPGHTPDSQERKKYNACLYLINDAVLNYTEKNKLKDNPVKLSVLSSIEDIYDKDFISKNTKQGFDIAKQLSKVKSIQEAALKNAENLSAFGVVANTNKDSASPPISRTHNPAFTNAAQQ